MATRMSSGRPQFDLCVCAELSVQTPVYIERCDGRTTSRRSCFRQFLIWTSNFFKLECPPMMGFECEVEVLDLLEANEAVIAKNVTQNLYERHIAPVFLGRNIGSCS